MDWKKELGIQVREGRDDLNLLQEELGERVALHKNMIGRYETGVSGPELDVLIKLAVALEKQEFRIGDHIVIIKPAQGVAEASSHPRQLRLEYGKEYVFTHGSPTKIPPGRESLFLISGQPKKGTK